MIDWQNIELDVWSRNWDEDEVEETFKPRTYFAPLFYWRREMREKLKETQRLPIKTLLIAFGNAAVLFFHSYLLEKSHPLVATLLLPELSLRNMSAKSTFRDPVCNIYQFDSEQTFLVLCQYDVSAERANAWTTVLFQHIHAEQVYIFGSIFETQLRDVLGSKLIPPFLRKLETDAQRIKISKDQLAICPYLESPTMIDKAPAAVLTYCQLRNIPATLYLSLEECHQLSSETLSAFETVLKHILPNFPVDKHNMPYAQLIQMAKSKSSNFKYLYL
jgi:hypothetical protein